MLHGYKGGGDVSFLRSLKFVEELEGRTTKCDTNQAIRQISKKREVGTCIEIVLHHFAQGQSVGLKTIPRELPLLGKELAEVDERRGLTAPIV